MQFWTGLGIGLVVGLILGGGGVSFLVSRQNRRDQKALGRAFGFENPFSR
jgi:hypothetical protein